MGGHSSCSSRRMHRLTRMKFPAIAFGLGLASALGFAPLNWWFVTLLCLAGLMWLVMGVQRLRGAALIGWCFGVGHFTFGNNWIAQAFTFQEKMPAWLGGIAVFMLALYLAIFPAFGAALAWRLNRLPIQILLRRHQRAVEAPRSPLRFPCPWG